MNDQLNKQLLKEETGLLQYAVATLLLSVEKCKKIGVKPEYTFEILIGNIEHSRHFLNNRGWLVCE